ncbi:MAG: glycosyltransferase family 4 protein [Candidatus Thiodiazotropha taylori]|uniref:Glycosyltransferase family 4 protein n=1 Tax=Candidatus Thiodiazotropha taylori TaxID=2792791 RepID=A0A9E4U2C5_9GAMM|nr:glycosyltransferase family 4 protein [Candidatus Thiodiazotropha taylori]MCG8026469.1 glycosyltransferase family 4 protein [Candidatus Thiodiazotropha taylori]MCG8106690.1 glycosyltransferase family 4 protein [Candidatus Thiodiazotropha taylori]MCG8110812.1 glycosyltransferase family 4 protein [Candidatus Thiodiazotropha taylori]MCW4256171.1 glycosyltransferase family 4 protein [Candidatus Thiodiazotropha taylori]
MDERKDKLVILDIRDSPWYDGPGRTIIEVAAGLRQQNIEIKIATFKSKEKTDSDYLVQAKKRGLDCFEITESKTLDFSIIGQILKYNETTPIDVIHTHDLRSNLFGLIAARKLKVPIVSTAHGWVANSLKRRLLLFVDKLMLAYLFDLVITVSDKTQSKLKRIQPFSSHFITVRNALDTQHYHIEEGDELRQSLGVSGDTTLIGKIGRLSPEKRQDQLLYSIKPLVDEGYKMKLLLIGIGPEEENLRQLTENLGLQDVVVFAGFIKDMQPVYSELDLVIQASSTEGMPNVVLESMLMRVPIIATDVGGTSEIIDSDLVGTLIEADNRQQMTDSIRSFLDSPQHYLDKTGKAEQRIREEFDSNIRLARMAEVYNSIL